ncbi:MAG: GNAT family N-acetyltransferase, partial [Nannocystaceae bacterium]|nr:GNAT family N-acetyltransferase [Nannocystaceae bacterium]
MGVSIRFATAADANTLHRFIVELAEYEREPEAVEVTVEQLAEQLEQPSPPFECLLAERDGDPCGFALFFHSYSTWRGQRCMYLEDLFVPETFRGAGVGELLLATLA